MIRLATPAQAVRRAGVGNERGGALSICIFRWIRFPLKAGRAQSPAKTTGLAFALLTMRSRLDFAAERLAILKF